MEFQFILHLMLTLTVISRTKPSSSHLDNITTSTDNLWTHLQTPDIADEPLSDGSPSSWTTRNTFQRDGNLHTGENELPPFNWTEMGFHDYPMNNQERQIGPAQRDYDLSYLVDSCGVFCDGNVKVNITPLCGDYTCSDCFCDELCSRFGDCCSDKNGTLPLMVADHTLTCVGPKSRFSPQKSYYMVKKCPSNSTEIKQNVNQELHPVTSLLSDQTYYNEFYALCNNDADFVTWDTENVCTSFSSCVDAFFPPQHIVMPRSCILHKSDQVVSQCNVSGTKLLEISSLNELCQSTKWLVKTGDVFYKNIFCYICNGEDQPKDCTNSSGPFGDIVSMSGLVSFIDDPLTDTEVLSTNCSEFEWMDSITEKCRRIHCLDGRYLSDGECLITNHTAEDTEYKFYVEFPLQAEVAYFSWIDLCFMFAKSVPKMLHKFDPLVYYFVVDYLHPHDVNSFSAVGLNVVIRSWNITQTHQFENSFMEFIWDDWVFSIGDIEVILKPRPMDYEMTVYDSLNFYFDPENKTCCSNIHYFDWLFALEETIEGFKAFPSDYINLASALPCPYIILDNGEYEIDSNETIIFLNGTVTLPKGSYRRFGTDTHICVSTMENAFYPSGPTLRKVKATTVQIVEGYLSLVCTSISLLSILLTFITFFKFSELRTLPIKTTMFLAGSMFVAQATFQFGADQTENKTICQFVGIAIHFMWLSVIFWMNVCCFHMFYVFVSSKIKISHSCHWRTLLKYSLYVYGMSSFIVLATVASNYIISNGKSLGYGGRLCYLNSALLVGLAFVLPLGLVIITNVILFVWTVLTIYRIRKIEKSLPRDHRNVFVYIKLSTLTGGFWLLAILAEVTNFNFLSIISVVLNGSQGLFIFVSYVLNKRVYKLWTRSWGKQIPKQSRSSQNTKSSTM